MIANADEQVAHAHTMANNEAHAKYERRSLAEICVDAQMPPKRAQLAKTSDARLLFNSDDRGSTATIASVDWSHVLRVYDDGSGGGGDGGGRDFDRPSNDVRALDGGRSPEAAAAMNGGDGRQRRWRRR